MNPSCRTHPIGRLRFDGVLIEDDDVDAEDFTSFGSLIDFVERLRSR